MPHLRWGFFIGGYGWMGRKRGTTESFIEKARKIHGERYDYSLVEYRHSGIKVKIICREHGVFEQQPDLHLRSKGCPLCAQVKRFSTTNGFIERARKAHGDKYDYSAVEYKGCQSKIKILCHQHGAFTQRPGDHLQGNGCPKCSRVHRYTTEEFVDLCKTVHGEKYDYSLLEYRRSKVKVKIVCYEHGVFEQTPKGHIEGKGCWKCTKGGYSPSAPGNLYLLQDGQHLKIGITNRPVNDRVFDLNRTRPSPFSIVKTWHFEDGEKALNAEKISLSLFRLKYKQQEEKWDGFTETFVSDDINHFISTLESIIDSLK